jgi:hypothetical protein
MSGPFVLPRSWHAGRVGLWGVFDTNDFGAALDVHITRAELEARLPAATFALCSPLGDKHPIHVGASLGPIEPFGPWSPERLATMASNHDAVVITGDLFDDEPLAGRYGLPGTAVAAMDAKRFLLGGLGDAEPTRPVVWSAVRLRAAVDDTAPHLREALCRPGYVSVVDEPSRRHLLDAGVDQGVSVVPDPAIVAPRRFLPSVLGRRLEYLRRMGWYPAEPALVVHAAAVTASGARSLAAALRAAAPRLPVRVVVLPGSCELDEEVAAELAGAVPGTYRLPAEATMEDVTAAIAASHTYLGASRAGLLTALAFGRPAWPLERPGEDITDVAELLGDAAALISADDLVDRVSRAAESRPDARCLDVLAVRVGEHFDRVADAIASAWELIQRPAVPRVSEFDVHRLVRAYQVTTERLHAERDVLARAARLAEADAAAARLTARAAEAAADAAHAELAALRRTRTFRWTNGPRRLWARRRRGRR